jgi:hypothetical protein
MKLKSLFMALVLVSMIGTANAVSISGTFIKGIVMENSNITVKVFSDESFDLWGSTDLINWNIVQSWISLSKEPRVHEFQFKPTHPAFFYRVNRRDCSPPSVPEPVTGGLLSGLLALGLCLFLKTRY